MNNLSSISSDKLKIALCATTTIVLAFVLVLTTNFRDIWGLVGLFALPNELFFGITILTVLVALFGGGVVSKLAGRLLTVQQSSGRLTIAIVIVVAVVIFWTLRSHNLILGDGMWLIEHVNEGKYSFSAGSVTIVTHIVTAKLLSGWFDSPALMAYRLISILSGLIYLLGSKLLSKELFASTSGRLFGFMSFLSLGVMQLFFGYVENYAISIALTPLFYYFVLRYLHDEKSILVVLLIFAIMCAFHLVAVSIGPAILILLYVNSKSNSLFRLRHVLLIGFLLLAGLGAFLFSYFLEGKAFVGLFESAQFPYTFISSQHLTDLLNRILLTSVFSVFLLVVVLFFRQKKAVESNVKMIFQRIALIAAVSSLLFSALIDPKLGAFRDWDLQSFFAVPLLVSGLSFVANNNRLLSNSNSLAAIAISFALFFTIPWIMYNHLPVENTIEMSSSIIDQDIHYSTEYDKGARMKSWAVLLNDAKVGAYAEAEIVIEKYLAGNPDDLSAVHMIGYSTMMLKKYEKSYQISQIVLSNSPSSSRYLLQTAYLAVLAGQYELGLEYLNRLPDVEKGLPVVVGVMAQANYGLGNIELAERQFYESMSSGNKEVEFLRMYAKLLNEKRLIDSSGVVMKKGDSLEAEKRKFK